VAARPGHRFVYPSPPSPAEQPPPRLKLYPSPKPVPIPNPIPIPNSLHRFEPPAAPQSPPTQPPPVADPPTPPARARSAAGRPEPQTAGTRPGQVRKGRQGAALYYAPIHGCFKPALCMAASWWDTGLKVNSPLEKKRKDKSTYVYILEVKASNLQKLFEGNCTG